MHMTRMWELTTGTHMMHMTRMWEPCRVLIRISETVDELLDLFGNAGRKAPWNLEEAVEVAMATSSNLASRHRVGSEPDAGTHESLAYFSYMKYLMDFLTFFSCEGAERALLYFPPTFLRVFNAWNLNHR